MSTLAHAAGVVCRKNCVLQLTKCQRCIVPHRQKHIWGNIQYRGLSEPLFKTPQLHAKQVQEDLKKNKEIKENLKKFRDERKKLEEADALLKAREKFKKVQEETKKSSTVFQKTFEDVKEKVSETVEEVSKSEFGKKGKEFTEELGKTAGKARETLSSAGESLSKSQPMKKVAEGVKTVSEELDELAFSRNKIYKAPEKLMKRTELRTIMKEEKEIKVDDETKGVTVHKDSKFYQSWQNFKENNAYLNSTVLTPSTLSETLTEINKYDPSFTPEGFAAFCENVVVPNILEEKVGGQKTGFKKVRKFRHVFLYIF
uniref:Mitochondrial import inner membrane translocase subunit TIM44 n=1 Tax=Magallana gigas TaxID=29159 RepID=K1PLB0_MAGGI